MASTKKRTKPKSLSHGRPPCVQKPKIGSVSSKATRTLIRSHHNLEKLRAKALVEGDQTKALEITKQIESQGGIESYQRASLLGQTNDRGGDSSRILMDWLQPTLPALKELVQNGNQIRLLEVGALSTTNACSTSRLFDVERIDLNSQADGITQQDFMERPLPQDRKGLFDLISLSLVLNYVPDAAGRGEMLLRTLNFLKNQKQYTEGVGDFLPALFLVLPASCVTNSRYMDEDKLEAIMSSLGYTMVRKKLSNKLVYYLWRLEKDIDDHVPFKKEELRSGKSRNNFAIIVK